MIDKIVIDATNGSIGRIASYAAKQALLGKSITIVNCNEALISGRKASILEDYKKTRARGSSTLKGPHFPRSPERILKRTIRGMLSYKQSRGNIALKNIICHNTTPIEHEESKKVELKKTFNIKTLKLKELSKLM